jgi:transposase
MPQQHCYVGLDVSLERTSICVLDDAGAVVWRGKCTSTPDGIATIMRKHAPGALRIGLETGPLSTWLFHELRKQELPIVCIDARHAKAALSLRVNKTIPTTPMELRRLCVLAGIAKSWSRAWTAMRFGQCSVRVRIWSPKA